MKQKKMVTITTDMFELTVFWNGMYVSLQTTIFIGLLAVLFFATKPATKRMCVVFLLIDIIAILFILLHNIDIQVEEYTERPDKPTKEELDVTVDHKETSSGETSSQETVKEKKPAKSKGPKEIKNKVPIPNPQAPKNDRPAPASASSPTPAPEKSDDSVPEPEVAQSAEQQQDSVISSVKPVSELTDDDWADLFNM